MKLNYGDIETDRTLQGELEALGVTIGGYDSGRGRFKVSYVDELKPKLKEMQALLGDKQFYVDVPGSFDASADGDLYRSSSDMDLVTKYGRVKYLEFQIAFTPAGQGLLATLHEKLAFANAEWQHHGVKEYEHELAVGARPDREVGKLATDFLKWSESINPDWKMGSDFAAHGAELMITLRRATSGPGAHGPLVDAARGLLSWHEGITPAFSVGQGSYEEGEALRSTLRSALEDHMSAAMSKAATLAVKFVSTQSGEFQSLMMDGKMKDMVCVVDAAGSKYALLKRGDQSMAWDRNPEHEAIPCHMVVAFAQPEAVPVVSTTAVADSEMSP